MDSSDVEERFDQAESLEDYLETAAANVELWRSVTARAKVPDDLLARARALPPRNLLVLSEDWCGDAVNTVPLMAALADAVPQFELRILARDRNLDLMDEHLSDGARAIPVIIAYDDEFRELGWWASRPAPLQAWVMSEGKAMAKEERYKEVRRWYANDRGRTTLAEIVAMLEKTAAEQAA